MQYQDVTYTSIPTLVEVFFEEIGSKRNINLVIVGANNGTISDFVTHYVAHDGVKAVMVEPLPNLYRDLMLKYGRTDGIILENTAIGLHNGKKTMYYLDNADNSLPEWCNGLGSFNKRTLLNHANQVRDLEKYLVHQSVPCLTFSKLMTKHRLQSVDILQIDTEGFDFEILTSIDLNLYQPLIIIAEYLHMSFYQYFAIISHLEANNYTVRKGHESLDIVAIHNSILD